MATDTTVDTASHARTSGYRKGDLVRVRSREEILATLAPDDTLDGLPFMPEMLKYAGQELPVSAAVHKTCDAINLTGTSRRM